jgi:hypothetical protein
VALGNSESSLGFRFVAGQRWWWRWRVVDDFVAKHRGGADDGFSLVMAAVPHN